jgi:hypothetical protein
VGDVAPLVGEVIVDGADALVVAVVLLRDVQVELCERVARDRLALLRFLVHAQLELRELRLPEHRALDVLEVVPEKRQPRVVVLDLAEHVVDEQRFVERGRHFGDEGG